jgi:hypothetical protein
MTENPRRPDDFHAPDEERRDSEADELIENLFPDIEEGHFGDPARPVFALIPEEVIHAPPDRFAAFLESVFEAGEELEEILDRSLTPIRDNGTEPGKAVQAVVPAEMLRARGADAGLLLDQVFDAFDEIDEVLTTLHEEGPQVGLEGSESSITVVPDHSLGDPVQLIRAIDRVRTDAEKLQLLLRQAKHCLRRLDRYRLTDRRPGQIVAEMRNADHLRTLQYLVEFLSSIHHAAESFEMLELPRPHIRDYLEHLYRMEDWEGMATLVRRLEEAVIKYIRDESPSSPIDEDA